MNIKDYDRQVDRVRQMVRANRPLWYRMDRAEIASYRWSVKFANGEVARPTVEKLVEVEAWLKANIGKKPRLDQPGAVARA